MVDYSTSNTAKLCGIIPTDSEHNHYSFIALTTTQLNNSGYAVYPSYTSFSSVDAFTNYLYDDADVFVIKCHGDYLSNSGYSRLLIKESANTATQKWYHSQNVLNMSTDALSAYRLMVFMACEAGTNPGIGKNVTSAVVNKGARAALGFSGNINSTYSNYWCADYFSYLQQGQTVYMAKYYIQLDGNYPSEYQLNTGVLVGDTSTTLYN